jgi:hypothetical protein
MSLTSNPRVGGAHIDSSLSLGSSHFLFFIGPEDCWCYLAWVIMTSTVGNELNALVGGAFDIDASLSLEEEKIAGASWDG